ncbi:MAG: hypothetical protein QXZ63_02445 [Sulfolobales archaeon]
MVRIRSATVGSFPRPRGLARLVGRFNSGKIDYERLEAGYETYTRKLFKLLVSSRIECFTDGMLRWDDIFNPLISYIDGVKVDGLYRFYENNFFFRAPQVVGKIKLKSDCPIPTWYKKSMEILNEVAGKHSTHVLKAVLPGPLTLAINSVNNYYNGIEDLVRDYAYDVLLPLLKELKNYGANLVEIHEPELTYERVDSRIKLYGIELISQIFREVGVKLWLQTYFGSACRNLEFLLYLSRYIVGIDLKATDDYSKCMNYFSEFDSLAIGVYDSRNTLIEKNRSVGWYVSRFSKLNLNELFITNNAPMDFIPEVIAVKKLRKLGRFVFLYNKVRGEA